MDETQRPYHSVANLFPLMQGDDFDALKADIQKNGQLEPIWIDAHGAIIDGRNRHRACLDLGIAPKFRTWAGSGSLVSFVLSLNLNRRHLTSSQRAALAVDVLPELEREARERHETLAGRPQKNGGNISTVSDETGKARDHAATMLNTNGRYVSDAKRIAEEAPDLFADVKAGNVTIPQAKRELNHRTKVDPPPMKGKYRVIYADPPWAYSNSGFHQSAEQHYPTMTVDELCDLPVAELADAPCALYLWATVPLLPDAIKVMEAWGFEYKTHRVWKKDRAPGMGWWGKTYHELLLIGTKNGNAHPKEKLPSVVDAPVGEHSAKPEQFATEIEAVHDGPYIEMFARRQREGWSLWGNEKDVQQ